MVSRYLPAAMLSLATCGLIACAPRAGAPPCHCAAKPRAARAFWEVQNVDASPEQVRELTAAVRQCTTGLKRFFPREPRRLVVYAYGDRRTLVRDLVHKLGFTEELAAYFKDNYAPVPQCGMWLAPPGIPRGKACHEIVHYYLKVNTNGFNEHAKWFDEGLANLLAGRAVAPEQLKRAVTQVCTIPKDKWIPFARMQGTPDWLALHRNRSTQVAAYLQALAVMHHFMQSYSVGHLKRILKAAGTSSVNQALEQVCGISAADFYEKWRRSACPPSQARRCALLLRSLTGCRLPPTPGRTPASPAVATPAWWPGPSAHRSGRHPVRRDVLRARMEPTYSRCRSRCRSA